MQPRQTGGGSGKSSDTIVYEMAAGILEKVVDHLDIDEARADMFEVSKNTLFSAATETNLLNKTISRFDIVVTDKFAVMHYGKFVSYYAE